MKKLLILLSLIISCMHVTSYAGDGASGGGSCSLWDSIFKNPASKANPKYANDVSEENGSILYREDSAFYQTSILNVHSFTTEDGAEVQIKDVVAFSVLPASINKKIEEITVNDIVLILTADGKGYPIEKVYRIELH